MHTHHKGYYIRMSNVRYNSHLLAIFFNIILQMLVSNHDLSTIFLGYYKSLFTSAVEKFPYCFHPPYKSSIYEIVKPYKILTMKWTLSPFEQQILVKIIKVPQFPSSVCTNLCDFSVARMNNTNMIGTMGVCKWL